MHTIRSAFGEITAAVLELMLCSHSIAAVRAEGQCQEIQHGRPCHEVVGWGLWRKGPGSLAPVELRSEV